MIRNYLIFFLIIITQGVTAANSSSQSENPKACPTHQNNTLISHDDAIKDARKCAKKYLFSISENSLPDLRNMTCDTEKNTNATLKRIIERQAKCPLKENLLSLQYHNIVLRVKNLVIMKNSDNFEALKQDSSLCSEDITAILNCSGIQSKLSNPVDTLATAIVAYTDMFFNGCRTPLETATCLINYMEKSSNRTTKCNTIIEKYTKPFNFIFKMMKCKFNNTELRNTLIKCHIEALNQKFVTCTDFKDFTQKLIRYSDKEFPYNNHTVKMQQINNYIGLLNITMNYEPFECAEKYKNISENCINKELGEEQYRKFNPDIVFDMTLDADLNKCFNYNNTWTCTLNELKNIKDTSCREKYSLYETKYYEFLLDAVNCTSRIVNQDLPLNPLNSSNLTPAHVGLLAVGIIIAGGIVSSVIYCKNRLRRRRCLAMRYQNAMQMK